ncbi:MAG: alpha/beta hydrolase [Acidimicrobiia bacterium]|nr:alpha/beta hydrolase [Acidimicrobiia bacterium]
MAAPDPDAFHVERAAVADGLELAYVREGIGGHPLLLIHGYPETKRIWWRNIGPLAEAGFEVIVPDLRGYGDSDLAPDGAYDPGTYATDLHTLVHGVLGHERCSVAAGDLGGVVLYDLGLRFPGFVRRQCFFNSVPPVLPELYAAAGIPEERDRASRPAADYFVRQGTDADGLAAELDTPERRRSYIADFYGHRFWAAPGSFDADEVAFMTEPFADGDRLRAAWCVYELSTGNRTPALVPRMFETNPIPTLVLYGPEDHVVPTTHNDRCEVAFEHCIGPFVVDGAGHFLQWERADVLNRTLPHVLLP